MKLEKEYRSAFDAYKANKTPETSSAMLDLVHPAIEASVRSHAGRVDPILMGRARREAVKALQTYDPGQASLRTHLHQRLHAMTRYAAQHAGSVKVPERIALDRLHLDRTEQNLEMELGRPPTEDELLDAAGLSNKRARRVRSYNPAVMEGTLDSIGADAPASVVAGDPKSDLWAQVVHDDLDNYHQTILAHSIGLNGRPILSTNELAARLRRTPGAISQAKKRIQEKLDEADTLSLL